MAGSPDEPPMTTQIKSQVRIMGLADGPFDWNDREVTVVGAVVRLPGYLEATFSTRLTVDGTDATASIADLVQESGYGHQLKALMVKGASMAGFNIIDGETLTAATGIPLITVSRQEPDMAAIRAALTKHFDDWQKRLSLLEAGTPGPVSNGKFIVYCHGYGLDEPSMKVMIQKATVQGALPEPLRLANLLARTVVRGKSGILDRSQNEN